MKICAIRKEFIFKVKDAPTNAVHASTVAVLQDGTYAAAWFGGSQEGADDVRIWFSFKRKTGWTKPQPVPGNAGIPHWNPVLFVNRWGELFLYYKVGRTIENWRTYFIKSVDNGENFTFPAPLVPGDIGGRGPVKNKPICLSDGTLLAPASIEHPDNWTCHIDRSEDNGKTWEKLVIDKPDITVGNGNAHLGMIQPTLWESEPGHVHALMRTNSGFAYRTDSTDGGRHFCTAYRTDIPNNNSGLDLARLSDGTLALVSNPVSVNWGSRSPLTVALSYDNGETFSTALTLEDGNGEFSYPSVVASSDDRLYITYTYLRQTVAFWQLGLA